VIARAIFSLLFATAALAEEAHPLEEKLRAIVIPEVELEDAPFGEAMSHVLTSARNATPDSKPWDFEITSLLDPGEIKPSITLSDTEVTLFDALRELTTQAGIEFSLGEDGVTLHAKGQKPRAAAPPRRLPKKMTELQKTVLAGMEEAIIESVEFDEATLEEAIQYLQTKAAEAETPLSFVIKGSPAEEGSITMQLKEVPLAIALDYTCELTRTHWTIGEFAIEIRPNEPAE
jgi:hypothetical protein